VYALEKLRCGLCGEVYSAEGPRSQDGEYGALATFDVSFECHSTTRLEGQSSGDLQDPRIKSARDLAKRGARQTCIWFQELSVVENIKCFQA